MEQGDNYDEISKRELEKRISELENRLIEQEHRFFTSLRNFMKYKKGDERKKAAAISLAYNFLFSSPGVAIGSSIIAIATIVILISQTYLMSDQNKEVVNQTSEIKHQNELIQEQVSIQQSQINKQRMTELITILYDPAYSNYSAKLKKSALLEYIQLKKIESSDQLVDLTYASLRGLSLSNDTITGVNFTGSDFSFSTIKNSVFECVFENAIFDSSYIFNADFKKSYQMSASSFRYADLNRCVFSSCDLTRADFSFATAYKCDLTGVSQGGLTKDGINITGAKIQIPIGLTASTFCRTIGVPDDVVVNDTTFLDSIRSICQLERNIIDEEGNLKMVVLHEDSLNHIFEVLVGVSVQIDEEGIHNSNLSN